MAALGRRVAVALGAVAMLSPAVAAVPDANALEWAVKASYLYKFAPFVVWPPRAFTAPNEPLTICIVGEDPFGAVLDQATQGQRVNGRPLLVRRIDTAAAGSSCHILFAGRTGSQSAEEVVRAVARQPVLTVTDASRGGGAGMIRFVLVDGRVRFVIDTAAAETSGIAISSKLLGLAVRVER